MDTIEPSRVPVTPRLAATVMVLRDGHAADDLEVLLLRRSTATPFVPGVHVFPGGALEPGDSRMPADVLHGLDADGAARMLGTHDALASWVAAARETFEEAGALLARTADGEHVAPDHPILTDADRHRAAVEDGSLAFGDLLGLHDLRLPLDEIAYVSRWITPDVSPRRYDTRFFAMAMPPGQQTSADGWEAVDSAWWSPSRALADWQAGTIELIEPTVASLQLLTRFSSTDEAMIALLDACRGPGRVLEPGGGVRVALDGESTAEPEAGFPMEARVAEVPR